MVVSCTGEDRALTVHISGEVDHHAAGKLMAELDQALETRLPRTVTVDLSGVTFMDSSGIAFALNAQRRMREIGGTMYLQGVGRQAMRVIRTSGVDRIMNIKEAVE